VTQNSTEWFVIINPVAGRGKAGRLVNTIASQCRDAGLHLTCRVSQQKLHVITLARDAVLAGYRRFIAVGGDGTANEVINGLLSQDKVLSRNLTLATVPVGTGNDWARSLGLPKRSREVIRLIADDRPVMHDIGKVHYEANGCVETRYFLNMAGLGLDGHVLRLMKDVKPGPWAYYLGLLKGFTSYVTSTLTISASGYTTTEKVLVVFAGSGTHCGGGMRIAPHAGNNDGYLYVTLVKSMGRWKLLQHVPRLLNGSLHNSQYVQSLRVTDIDIESRIPVQVEADGELLGHTPLHISVIPRSLRVVTGV
jgi:YegS/Rv2252/BmrU family lipid kinase